MDRWIRLCSKALEHNRSLQLIFKSQKQIRRKETRVSTSIETTNSNRLSVMFMQLKRFLNGFGVPIECLGQNVGDWYSVVCYILVTLPRFNLEMHRAIVTLGVSQNIYDNIIIATVAEISGVFASFSAVVQQFPAAHAPFFAAEEVSLAGDGNGKVAVAALDTLTHIMDGLSTMQTRSQ